VNVVKNGSKSSFEVGNEIQNNSALGTPEHAFLGKAMANNGQLA
jgi:hypothetical protein